MRKEGLAQLALENLRASANESWPYLCGSAVESFGFFLWEWVEDCGIEVGDDESARRFAQSGEQGVAWLVPVKIDDCVEGIALFTGHAGNAPEDAPVLEGVFGTVGEAKAHLRLSGVIAEASS